MHHRSVRESVQHQYVCLEEVQERVLCLRTASQQRSVVAILMVDGINYDLKSQADQTLLLDHYHAFLSTLRFPIQILTRVVPIDLQATLATEPPAFPEEAGGIWEHLYQAQHTFLAQLAARRPVLERQMYVIIRVPITMLSSSSRRFWKTAQTKEQITAHQRQAQEEVELRCEEVQRALSALGLRVQRVSGTRDLLRLVYACFLMERMQRAPVADTLLDGIGQLPQTDQGFLSPLRHQKGLHQDVQETGAVPLSLPHPADLVAPASIEQTPSHLVIEQREYVRGFVVSQLPRLVVAGWLRALAEIDESVECSFHLQPCRPGVMIEHFRRQRTRHQSSLVTAQQKGSEGDPYVKIAEADLSALIERLASGEERMLNLSFFVLVRASSEQELQERSERVFRLLHGMQLSVRPALFEQDRLFRSCLPYGLNELPDHGMVLDSRSAATMFHFQSSTIFHPGGILEGVTPHGNPIVIDPWGAEMNNANRLVLGPPGCGKSYHIKMNLLRQTLRYARPKTEQTPLTFQVVIVDPEREYVRETLALGGQVIRLAPGSPHHLNPFDLPPQPEQAHGDHLADHIQRLHTLLDIMLADRGPHEMGTLTAAEKGLLDRALYETYRRVGITRDPKTHDRPAPLLRDLFSVLESEMCGRDPSELTARLHRYVHGSLSGLFAQPTNVALDRVVIHFDIHDLETELRPVGLFLVSNFVWSTSFQSTIPRQFLVDEAASLYQYASGARFLEELLRRARKHYLGVTLISQHPHLFQQSAIPANCATQVLMRQDATTLDLIEQMFKLTPRELQLVRRLPVGEAFVITGEKRVHVRFERNDLEHALATTDPKELAHWHTQRRQTPMWQAMQKILATEQWSIQAKGGEQ